MTGAARPSIAAPSQEVYQQITVALQAYRYGRNAIPGPHKR